MSENEQYYGSIVIACVCAMSENEQHYGSIVIACVCA
jgi:hypothetical protein